MRCLVWTFALVLVLVSQAVADAPLGKAALKELKTIEGEWLVRRIETTDGKHEPDEADPITLTIKGTKWAFGTIREGEIVALGPTTSPKTLDLKSVRKGRKSIVNEAVYKVTGDVMVIAIYRGKDKQRPTSLDKPTKGDTILWTLKRAKK